MLNLFSLANFLPYSVYLWTTRSQFSINLLTRFSLSMIDFSSSLGITIWHLVNNDDWFLSTNGCAVLLEEKEKKGKC